MSTAVDTGVQVKQALAQRIDAESAALLERYPQPDAEFGAPAHYAWLERVVPIYRDVIAPLIDEHNADQSTGTRIWRVFI